MTYNTNSSVTARENGLKEEGFIMEAFEESQGYFSNGRMPLINVK